LAICENTCTANDGGIINSNILGNLVKSSNQKCEVKLDFETSIFLLGELRDSLVEMSQSLNDLLFVTRATVPNSEQRIAAEALKRIKSSN
jgi:hypothetical protein